MAYRRAAETRWQRTITLIVAVACLMGSIFATLTQLAGTSFGLNTLAPYRDTIEFIAPVMLLVLTTAWLAEQSRLRCRSSQARLKFYQSK